MRVHSQTTHASTETLFLTNPQRHCRGKCPFCECGEHRYWRGHPAHSLRHGGRVGLCTKAERVGMKRRINPRSQKRIRLHDPFVMQLSTMGKTVKYRHLGESSNVVVTQQPIRKSRVTVIRHGFRKWSVCGNKKRQRRDSNTRGKIPLT